MSRERSDHLPRHTVRVSPLKPKAGEAVRFLVAVPGLQQGPFDLVRRYGVAIESITPDGQVTETTVFDPHEGREFFTAKDALYVGEKLLTSPSNPKDTK